MKQVSIQDVKRFLSRLIEEAAAGERILITNHNRPVACLGPVAAAHSHVGKRCGQARIGPAIKRPLSVSVLDLLEEDRHGGPDR